MMCITCFRTQKKKGRIEKKSELYNFSERQHIHYLGIQSKAGADEQGPQLNVFVCLFAGSRILRIKVNLAFFKLQVDCPLIFHSALDTHTTLPNLPIPFPLGLSNLIPIALQQILNSPSPQQLETIQQKRLAHHWKEKSVDFSVNVNFFFDYKYGINYHPPQAND